MNSINALLLTGQSSQWHNWPVSSPVLERYLREAGFSVEVIKTPAAGESFEGFAPEWSRYDVVVLDYEGDEWPESVKASFETYMAEGGGLVIYHATDNAFPEWKEFNRMIGVGGWAGRNEKDGPMVRWRDGKMVFDHGPGEATHPKPYPFLVTTRTPEHPVMQGLPAEWLHAPDELYSQLRGPAENLTVLATACADPKEIEGGTGENEPLLMTIEYGKGRVFHTALGHVHFDETKAPEAIRCIGFVETFLRGTEWAATGAVTRSVPDEFPDTEGFRVGNG